ncbi:hypothetical protein [Spirosoma gilvum]
MNCRLHPLLLFTVSFALLCIQSVFAKPTWTFSVVVAVEKQTADYYQNMLSKSIEQIVKDQMATVNANFNSSPNFNGIYDFRVDSIYVFDGYAPTEVFRPHPHFTYAVVIDGKFTSNSQGGGWLGNNQVIYHKWDWSSNFDSGPFGSGATDGLTHEFGHARGGVDIYGMRVEGSNNPVSGETFEPVNSIMNFPYGNIVWDEYTTNLLNSTAGDPIVGNSWILDPFPGSIGIKTVDYLGQPLGNVKLDVFPVNWFSYSVASAPVTTTMSQMDGSYTFSPNPFQPGSTGYPWLMRYSNFLIKATYNATVVYKWMPLYDVQNAYFRNGANSAYTAEVAFPASTPMLKLTGVSATTVCSPTTISVSFTASGSFPSDNTFNLNLIDNFNSTTTIGSITSTSATAISGTIPAGIRTGAHSYSLVIVSTNPEIRTSTYPITINSTPIAPVAEPLYLCQYSTAEPLQATGPNLLWYTNPSGGTGSPTAPIPNTSQPTLLMYFVSKTLNGCESARTMLMVTIYAAPNATLTQNGPLTTSQTSATLTASGGYLYAFSGPGILSQDTGTGQAVVNASGTYSVTVTAKGGCTNTASVALAGTDLSPTLVLPQSNFGAVGADRVRNFVVNIYEVTGLPTAVGQATITITVPTGYTISFDSDQTSIEVSGAEGEPVSVDNPRWQVSNEIAGQQLTLTMKSGERITGAGQSVVGFQIVRTTANSGSVSSITVNVTDDASKAYDGNPANNVYARIISGL